MDPDRGDAPQESGGREPYARNVLRRLTATGRDPLGAVLLVLLSASAAGAAVAVIGAIALRNPVFLDTGLALLLAAGLSTGTAFARDARARAASEPDRDVAQLLRTAKSRIGTLGGFALACVLLAGWFEKRPAIVPAALAAAGALLGAWLAGASARYLAGISHDRLPEAQGLARGGRVLAWMLVASAASSALAWLELSDGLALLHVLLLAMNAVVLLELVSARTVAGVGGFCFPTELPILAVFGSRANPLASALDWLEAQLGIDLRSSWALTVVRRSAAPMLAGALLLGWLASAVTVLGPDEQALVERLGVAASETLAPGAHFHWPWPIDRVYRAPVRRVQVLHIGAEEEESAGPENVLWARQHSASEYTLLLGDGRDLLALDAALQFRIRDLRDWHYRCANPVDALRAIAYRAVMNATVSRTLAQTLSENVSTLTQAMRARVQADADDLGLGVEVVAFTVGGMHPPVGVASDYEAVVSAALEKTTAEIEAQAHRNETVPAAEAEAAARVSAAHGAAAEARGAALGEAGSFEALVHEYREAPAEFRFRRRLERLEERLSGRRFTVLDSRIQRDGGELWLMK